MLPFLVLNCGSHYCVPQRHGGPGWSWTIHCDPATSASSKLWNLRKQPQPLTSSLPPPTVSGPTPRPPLFGQDVTHEKSPVGGLWPQTLSRPGVWTKPYLDVVEADSNLQENHGGAHVSLQNIFICLEVMHCVVVQLSFRKVEIINSYERFLQTSPLWISPHLCPPSFPSPRDILNPCRHTQ